MNFGLSQELLDSFRTVFRNHPEVEEVLIYGSRAKGGYREGSDIDLSMKGEDLTGDIRSRIALELDDLNSPYLMDLSVYHHLKSEALKAHIDRHGQLLYRSRSRLASDG